MIASETLAQIVAVANLAPSIHNAQPTRWKRLGDGIAVGVDLSVQLPAADPTGSGIALSCGAAVEATVLAASLAGLQTTVTDVWNQSDQQNWQGHRIAAMITFEGAAEPAPLAAMLDKRMTWRAAFAPDVADLFGWSRDDMRLVTDAPTQAWIADLNDDASHRILSGRAFRQELLGWMRLSPRHRRAAFDGMNLAALHLTRQQGARVNRGLGALWPLFRAMRRTRALTAEARLTRTAPVIACFHRPADESPIATGRAYLRMWLEATQLGFAGWPMAALGDDAAVRDAICSRFGIGADRRLVQVLRFGAPTGPMPPKARRPLAEILIDG